MQKRTFVSFSQVNTGILLCLTCETISKIRLCLCFSTRYILLTSLICTAIIHRNSTYSHRTLCMHISSHCSSYLLTTQLARTARSACIYPDTAHHTYSQPSLLAPHALHAYIQTLLIILTHNPASSTLLARHPAPDDHRLRSSLTLI